MPLPTISGEFRIVGNPELRFTPSGAAVWKARCVAEKKKKSDDGNSWVDDKTMWVNVSVWRDPAENAVESLRDKDLITVVGEVATTDYQTTNGEKRTSVDITAFSIGPSLRFRKTPHHDQPQGQPQQQQQYPPQQQQHAQQPPQYAQPPQQYAQQQGGYPPQQQQYPPQQPQQQQAWPPASAPNDPPF